MKLAEPIFLSLQGEWPNTWLPSIFIRFYGCNLCCNRCDSLYAVNNPESIIEITPKEAVLQINKMNCNHIIFTWWEPTLFFNEIEELQHLLDWIGKYTYEVETNGSFPIRNRFNQVNISPKLLNSWNKPYELKTFKELLYGFDIYPMNTIFKFVCRGKEDTQEILEYIQKYNIPNDKVYIMPMWITKKSQINKEVLQFCLDNWFRYCQRMHIILFGNKKWV